MKKVKKVLAGFLSLAVFFGFNMSVLSFKSAYAQPSSINPAKTTSSLKSILVDLLNTTTDTVDTDSDGIPDSIENILGTSFEREDTDFDKINDYDEIMGDLDPLNPDSNFDGLPDYYEVTDVASLDIDNDGFINAWDLDNDGDGVNDAVDVSPFYKSDVYSQFHLDVTTSGNPTYINFQIIPSNPEHLKLFGKKWNWPDTDNKGAIQDLDSSREDVEIIPMLQIQVNQPPEYDQVYHQNMIIDENSVSLLLLPITEHGNIVAFTARLPYTKSVPLNISLDASLVWNVVGTTDEEGADPKKVQFVAYKENFVISGMTIEELHGTDTGLFYSADKDQTIAANLILAYEFLRSTSNHVPDMSAILVSNNVDVNEELSSFAHKDEALLGLSNDRIPDVLDSLPNDKKMPIVIIMEERSRTLEMSEFSGAGGAYSADLTTRPVMTVKTLKTPWYDTTSDEALKTSDMMQEISGFPIEAESKSVLVSLMLYWNTGEQTFHGFGIPPMDVPDDYSLVPDVVEDIVSLGLGGLTALFEINELDGIGGLGSYKSSNFLYDKGLLVEIDDMVPEELGKLGDFDKYKKWTKQCDVAADNSKAFKYMDDVMEGIDIASLFIDTGSAAYSVIVLSQLSDLSGLQFNNALMKTTMEYYVVLAEFMIGAIPVVGWFIGLSLVIADYFGDWSGKLTDWLVSIMSNVTHRVTPNVEIVGDPSMEIDDKDGNGVDVGDRITYKSDIMGEILGTQHYWSLVYRSEILPYYRIFEPSGSNSLTGSLESNEFVTGLGNIYLPIPNYSQMQRSSSQTEGWKSDQYEAGAWIEPGTAMVNFPVKIRMDAFYELWYEWEHFVYLGFYGFWCHHNDRTFGINSGGAFTLYVDVMPGSVGDFASWKGITPLDRDSDGLLDADETSSNMWMYDSDSDGLNDKFEIENGTDPLFHDSDKDGLIDWFEFHYKTDPLNPDTDSDGLEDYLEVAGWLIEFDYALTGRTYVMRVYSDPNVPDTDGDGVNDYMEYKSQLNPSTWDTNGDGEGDVAKNLDKITDLEFLTQTDFNLDSDARDIAVDEDGYIYVIGRGALWKFDQDLHLVMYRSVFDGLLAGWPVCSLAIDDVNDRIHMAYRWGYRPAESGVYTFDKEGNPLTPASNPWAKHSFWGYWGYTFEFIGLDVDSDGNIYVLRRGYEDTNQPEHQRQSYMEIYNPDRQLLDTWGEYAELITRSDPYPSPYSGLLFDFDNEIFDFNNIFDFVLDDYQDSIFLCEEGVEKSYWEYHPDSAKWVEMNREKVRPDRIATYGKEGVYARDLYHFTDPETGVSVEFSNPRAIALDANRYIFMVDKDNIYKFDSNMQPISMWNLQDIYIDPGLPYNQDNRFQRIVFDNDNNMYTFVNYTDLGAYPFLKLYSVIQKYAQIPVDQTETIVDTDPDRDKDGLTNDEESAGWDVVFISNSQPQTATSASGVLYAAFSTKTVHVTSNPLLIDTDSDGLSDLEEYQKGTNPADPDTDDDGIGDFDDPDPLNFDADFDGVPDGVERTLGSNPVDSDSDNDGLSDAEEFLIDSDPMNADTDNDGVSDYEEYQDGTNLFDPDSDGDFMFDGKEKELGTDPLLTDSDNDGLSDGDESMYNTDPKNADSDGDNIPDGVEVDNHLDPTSDDTDKDGVPDGVERERGTDPFNQDSDRDGIPDNIDGDTDLNQVADLVIAVDPSDEAFSFIENLKDLTTVTVVTVDELLAEYNTAPRIVLVGRPGPDGNKAVGMLITELLSDTPDVLQGMIQSDDNRLSVRYGLWTPTQSIVMLSIPYAQDHLQVLDILRSKTVTIEEKSAEVEYTKSLKTGGEHSDPDQTLTDYTGFYIDEIDIVKHTDSIIAASLNQDIMPSIDISSFNEDTTPVNLKSSSGLNRYDYPIGQYIEFDMGQTNDNVTGAMIKVYYRESSCDVNNNGFIGDPEDIDEATLGLYYFNDATGMWEKLTSDEDWVYEVGVNINNVELYGESYGGFIWANVAHLSLYGLSGQTFNNPPDVSGAFPSKDILWPPNKELVDVTVEGVTDPDGDEVTITILNITSNEPEDEPNAKKHTPDMFGVGTDTASLRAERAGSGDGRVYEITFVASDGRGGESEGTVHVLVPHDQSKK